MCVSFVVVVVFLLDPEMIWSVLFVFGFEYATVCTICVEVVVAHAATFAMYAMHLSLMTIGVLFFNVVTSCEWISHLTLIFFECAL